MRRAKAALYGGLATPGLGPSLRKAGKPHVLAGNGQGEGTNGSVRVEMCHQSTCCRTPRRPGWTARVPRSSPGR